MIVGIFDSLSPQRGQFQIPSGYTIDFDGNLDYIEVEESEDGILISPLFEIASNPTISLADIRVRRFRIVEGDSLAAREAEESYDIESIGFSL